MSTRSGRPTRWKSLLLTATIATVFPCAARSQAAGGAPDARASANLVGEIVDRRSEDPIPAARINLVRASDGASVWSGVSGDDGEFRTSPLPLGEYRLQVEAPPFVALAEPVTLYETGTVDLRVEMVGVDYELEPVVAVARRASRLEREGFYRRLAQGTGDFVTRADIDARQPPEPSDLLRRLPSVILGGGTGSPGGPQIFLRGRGRQGADPSQPGCTPLFVFDGVPMDLDGPWGLDNLVTPDNLEAIEVHRGAFVPPQYAGLTDCGVVMVWTREPGAGGRLLPGWKKLLAAGGLVGLVILLTR